MHNTQMCYICTSLIAVYVLIRVIEEISLSGNKLVRVSIAAPIQNWCDMCSDWAIVVNAVILLLLLIIIIIIMLYYVVFSSAMQW